MLYVSQVKNDDSQNEHTTTILTTVIFHVFVINYGILFASKNRRKETSFQFHLLLLFMDEVDE